MDFEFSEEQVAIRDTIRELVQDRVAPRAAEIDEKGEYPKDIEKLFAQNGILGIPFPEQYGGISGSSVSICMGIEEIAKACASSLRTPNGRCVPVQTVSLGPIHSASAARGSSGAWAM